MPRPIQACINLSAISHNHRLAQKRAASARVWAVVKADAYGHGLLRVTKALAGTADGFALLDIEAAVALRDAGIQQPILLLEGFFERSDLEACVEYGLTVAIHRLEQLQMVRQTALSAPLPVYLKFNTGMNRLGFTAGEILALKEELTRNSGIDSVTLMTHFADADEERGVAWQLERFREMTEGWNFPICMANSAALLRYPQTAHHWVRPGIMLYGASPFADVRAASLGLRPVMTLRSHILSVQDIAAGERVGYGGIFEATRPMRIGIVACGYADGYPRQAANGAPILVAGQRTLTVGRVSMDMLACDLTEIPEASIGSPVVLWGEGLPAEEVAAAAGTISYELFCALAKRVPILEVED